MYLYVKPGEHGVKYLYETQYISDSFGSGRRTSGDLQALAARSHDRGKCRTERSVECSM